MQDHRREPFSFKLRRLTTLLALRFADQMAKDSYFLKILIVNY